MRQDRIRRRFLDRPLIVMLVGACLTPAVATAQKPVPPVSLSLSFEEATLQLGGRGTLNLAVTADADIPQARLWFALPPDVVRADGTTTWQGHLEKGRTVVKRLEIELLMGGDYGIAAEVHGSAYGLDFGRRVVLSVVARDEGVWTSPEPLEILRRRVEPPPDPRVYLKLSAVTPPDDAPPADLDKGETFIDEILRAGERQRMAGRAEPIAGAAPVRACFSTDPPDHADGRIDGRITARPGQPVTFDASCAAADGGIAEYRWDFGDGTRAEGGVQAQHSYSAGQGARDAVLTVLDREGRSGTARMRVSIAPALDATVVVSGRLTYVDANGGTHPIRLARVEVIDEDLLLDDVIGTGYSLFDGSYSIIANGGDVEGGPDIKVRVHTEIAAGIVARVAADLTSDPYYIESPVYPDVTGGALTIDLQTDAPVRGSVTDPLSPRAFSVLDAALQGGLEAYVLRGGNLLPRIPIVFPGTGTSYYQPSGPLLNILRADALDWDVMLHEWGHWTADNPPATFDDSPGGNHSGPTTIPEHGKEKGVRLAWSEGWATFFAVAIQVDSVVPTPVPPVPNGGDGIYQDTEDATLSFDLETVGGGDIGSVQNGYASEWSVMGVLWDLIDPASDTSTDSNAQDTIDARHQDVWNVLLTGPWDDVGKFWTILAWFLGDDVKTLLAVGQVFALNNMGAELVSPGPKATAGATPPTFTWMANGDPGVPNDSFVVAVTRDDWNTFTTFGPVATTSFTMSQAEWDTLTAGATQATTFKWLVVSQSTPAPLLPAIGFTSNVHEFTIRAVRIELTWPLLGADVDLHLRPPDGENYPGHDYPNDCAFYNLSPEWGVPGDASDNPVLDRDCIDSCTREIITLDRVTDPGVYKIVVHYYSDHGLGSTTSTVRVLFNNVLLFTDSRTLSDNEVWFALSITVNPTGPPTATAIDRVEKGAVPAVGRLKKKARRTVG